MPHTPEPWSADRVTEIGPIGISAGPTHIGEIIGTGDAAEDAANAARIVACVNACAGISDPAATLRSAREAIAWALGEMKRPGHPYSHYADMWKQAEALLVQIPKG